MVECSKTVSALYSLDQITLTQGGSGWEGVNQESSLGTCEITRQVIAEKA